MDIPQRTDPGRPVKKPSTYSVYINKQFAFLQDSDDDTSPGGTTQDQALHGETPSNHLVHISDSTIDGRTAKPKSAVLDTQPSDGSTDKNANHIGPPSTVCNGVANSANRRTDKTELQTTNCGNNSVTAISKDSSSNSSVVKGSAPSNSSNLARQQSRKESVESQIISSSFSFLPQYEASMDRDENGDDEVIVPAGTPCAYRPSSNKPMSRVSQFITDQFDFLPADDETAAERATPVAEGDTDSVMTGSVSLSTGSDCSDDTGAPWVYAESLRYSTYIFDESKTTSTGSHINNDRRASDVDIMTSVTPENDAIDLDTDNPRSPWFDGEGLVNYTASHMRSESTSTTASERDFRDKYLAEGASEEEKSPCLERNGDSRRRIIRRRSSTSTYKRLSEKFTEAERRIEVIREPADGDHYGFHLLGPNPIIVTTVETDSAASRAGIICGDVIFSVNDENVLESTLEEVIAAINKTGSGNLVLGLCANPDQLLSERPLCCGYLEKQADTNIFKGRWKRRWFQLKPDNCLYYYKNEKDDTPMGAIPLANYTVIKATDVKRDNVFKLVKYGNKTHYLQAESASDMDRWASVISSQAPAPRNEAWLEVSSNNVGLPALSIKKPDCHGYLNKLGQKKSWRKRYCVLKDACLYYYGDVTSTTAKGVAHLHGYTLKEGSTFNKKFTFTVTPPEPSMRTFCFCSENETDMKRWCTAMESSIGKWVKVSN